MVTVLFSDVSGSTALGERLDPEAVRALMGRYFGAMKAVIERHGGTVEKFIGDAVMAVFGIPAAHDDDALRAVRAAVEMSEALAALNAELANEGAAAIMTRTGITTGEVVAGDPSAGQTLVTGDAVNTAARLEQAAAPGEILIGVPTWRLVHDAVIAEAAEAVSAKGKAEPLPAYRLHAVIGHAEGHARRLDAPLFGRESELASLTQAYADAISERRCHLCTLLGAAGIGKSRLVSEFLAGNGDAAQILRGRCLPYGEGITYWPLAEALKGAAGIDDRDDRTAARHKLIMLLDGEPDAGRVGGGLATAIGLSDDPAPQSELFSAVRRVLEHMARRRPLIVVWEDIHWAESTFLDLIDHLTDWSRDVPLFLLAPARPELLDARPGWGGGKFNSSTLRLEALPDEAASRLIDALSGGSQLPDAVRSRIATAAEGNPLFVEELLAMLVDEGVLQFVDGRWQVAGDLNQLTIPPTIHALLAARLDRLSTGEREVAARASVVGRVFEPDAVAALSPPDRHNILNARLMALVRRELVLPARSELTGGDAFKFRHILIRDAAYRSLPKRERADLHDRFADWLENTTADRSGEVAEVVAFHLGQAVIYRTDLGIEDEHRSLRAADRLIDAGNRAYERSDLPAASSFLRRGLAIASPGTQVRHRALSVAIRVMVSTGDIGFARALASEAMETGELRIAADARLMLARIDMNTDRDFDLNDAVESANHAIGVFSDLGDELGLSRAWSVQASVFLMSAQEGDGLAAAERALDHALRSGNRRQIALCRTAVAAALAEGPVPAARAEQRIREIISGEAGSGEADPGELASLAWLQAIQGQFDAARISIEEARLADEKSASVPDVMYDTYIAARIEMFAGDWSRAQALLAEALSHAEGLDDQLLRPAIYAELSACQFSTGDNRSHSSAVQARATAVASDVGTQVRARAALARALASRGQFDAAVRETREAIQLTGVTENLELRADAFAAHADVLAAKHDYAEARVAAARALELFNAKGHLAGADRVRGLIEQLPH
jgi:class 3 adenylate cyclase/tetratricopeptide (TPR) repeat protein